MVQHWSQNCSVIACWYVSVETCNTFSKPSTGSKGTLNKGNVADTKSTALLVSHKAVMLKRAFLCAYDKLAVTTLRRPVCDIICLQLCLTKLSKASIITMSKFLSACMTLDKSASKRCLCPKWLLKWCNCK